MEEVLSRLQTLTPDELRVEITRAGLKCGPITATTRGIFEKKLARTLLENQGDGVRSEVGSGDQGTCSSEQTQSQTADPEVTKLEREDLNTSAQSLEDVSQQASPESPSVFYGVLPPLDDPLLNDGALHVYADKQKALRAVMKMKGARFKAFSSREEAENFAKGISDGGLSPNNPSAETSHITSPAEKSISLEMANMEKPNEFRSPRTQDLTAKLRRAVEKGDEKAFKELVWSNPRYLIGSGDNPTIVQEGCRYNVLHVAAKENQPGMARLILETLESPEFMRLMYPDDQEDMLWQRIDYIVDLYLNTPDKASNETPLHFACKFGCTEVVNVLCSHPAIDKNCRNKYGQKPSSVICERKNKSKETKQKINDYLEDRFFVPLLRATDNTLNPVIGVPWAPGSSECADLSLSPGLVDDPKNPVMTIRAFAGPLNRLKAEEFHKLWKTPPRNRARYFHDILKSDPDRGAERVGRELAHEMRYPWAEYWDFLSCFTDLFADDGLNMLEEFLNKNKKGSPFTGHEKEPSSISGTFLDDHLRSPSGMSRDSGTDENSPGSFHKKYPVCDLLQEFERVSLSQASEDSADSGLGCLAGSRERSSVREREWTEDDDSSSEEYYTADEGTDTLCQEDGSGGQGLPACGILARPSPGSRGEWDLNSSGSSNSSYKSTLSIPEETGTTEGLWQNIFLTGESPAKLDNEVLLAITGMDIEEQLYPCVTKWKNTVLSYPESQRQRWPNVSLMNRYPESKTSTPHRLTRSWLTGSPSFLNMKKFIPGPCMYNSTPSKTSTSS
ncbi:ankyrin repeat and LEM domain-containing protein 2 isoform X2 [Colossoma macropomum]|uniref:ankyrin repeat and LEM domain-containing protein 2 isoform X2 n=1 Tax=Colossoma macropomum TaxID=42526 RepID=UPI0018652A73|nr:ankyrin repeat and LEM domain-containing protein 2 isoform X2 [Colossoma macropomum]